MVLVVACGGADKAAVTSDKLAPPEQQILRVRLLGEPKTIDPHIASTVSEASITKPLFGGLFTYDEQLNVVPNIATELPSVENGGISADGLTYTVKLDKDAKWSDGQPLTAKDLVYSMKRALDPKVAGPYAAFFTTISGARDYNKALGTSSAPKTPSDSELAALRDKVGVSARDDNTVVYQLTQPNPSFLNLLALWTAYPVRQDVVEKYGSTWTEAEHNVSSGPFFLKEWAHNERMILEPNPYWAGEKPHLTRLVINFIADEAAAYAAYMNDELDSVVVPAASRREVMTPGSPLHNQMTRVAELTTYAVFMNNKNAPYDNMKVRQAIGMAIDRDAFVEGVLQNGGRPTTSWIPPGMPGYNGDIGKQYEYNPAKAKALLAEAGYPDGKGLTLNFMAISNDASRLTGQFIEDQLKKNLGAEVVIDYLESKVYSARLAAHDYDATVQRWGADWPYPDNWLPELFGSGSSGNYFNYSNPKFDDLVKRAALEPTETKRLALYDEAQKVMIDDAALMPLYNREQMVLVKPNVKGLAFTGIDGAIKGDYFFDKAYIAAAQ